MKQGEDEGGRHPEARRSGEGSQMSGVKENVTAVYRPDGICTVATSRVYADGKKSVTIEDTWATRAASEHATPPACTPPSVFVPPQPSGGRGARR